MTGRRFTKDIWAVEYSPTQKEIHIDTLERILETNRRTVSQGITPGFVLLHIAPTIEQAHAFAEQWEEGDIV